MKRPRIFYGWWIVLACFFVALSASCARNTFTGIFPAMLADLGWTRAAVSFGFTLHMVVYAIMAILIGRLVDRFGARWLMAPSPY